MGLAPLDKGEASLTIPHLLSQLEEFLNQSSPFYFWINGDRIDSLMENDREQSHVMDVMEDSFTRGVQHHGRALPGPVLPPEAPGHSVLLPLQLVPEGVTLLQSQVPLCPERDAFPLVGTLQLPRCVSALLRHDPPGPAGHGRPPAEDSLPLPHDGIHR